MSDETCTLNDAENKLSSNDKYKIGGDFTVIKQHGFLRNIVPGQNSSGKKTYRFQIRYIDNNDVLQEPDEWYSGFGDAPAKEGDYVIFNYKKNGQWNNVKDIIDVKFTHEDCEDSDTKELEEIKQDIDDPEIINSLNGDGETSTLINIKERDDLSIQCKALILNATIHLCTRRGTLSDADIIAQYNRFIQLL